MKDKIDKLRQEATRKQDEADVLEVLFYKYPDLREWSARWNKIGYCSKSVNHCVSLFEKRYNCGCCSDSPLEIFPYIETAYGKIYSDPPKFTVGYKSDYDDEEPNSPRDGWDKEMMMANIPESVIDAMRKACFGEKSIE